MHSVMRGKGRIFYHRARGGHRDEQRPNPQRGTMELAKPKVVRDPGACNRHLVAVLTALCYGAS